MRPSLLLIFSLVVAVVGRRGATTAPLETTPKKRLILSGYPFGWVLGTAETAEPAPGEPADETRNVKATTRRGMPLFDAVLKSRRYYQNRGLCCVDAARRRGSLCCSMLAFCARCRPSNAMHFSHRRAALLAPQSPSRNCRMTKREQYYRTSGAAKKTRPPPPWTGKSSKCQTAMPS